MTTVRLGAMATLLLSVACGSKKTVAGDGSDDGSGGDSSTGGTGTGAGTGGSSSTSVGGKSATGGTSSNAGGHAGSGAGTGSGGTSNGGSSSTGTGGSNPGNCKTIVAAAFATGDTPGWLVATATPAGEDTKYVVRIELDEGKGYKQAPGTFDLSKEPDYASANHAVIAFSGGDDIGNASTVYFQSAGSMKLDTVSSPVSAESKGSITSVTLVESTVDSTTFASTPVAGGTCLFVSMAAWDTTVASGATCVSASDCGDTSKKVCDPGTGTCVASQCDGGSVTCPGSGICVIQASDSLAGACYTSCTPLASGQCGGSAECVNDLFDQTQGVCKKRGTATEGMPCTGGDVATGCASGLVCAIEEIGNLCRAQCDYWSSPSCATGQHCELGAVCSTAPVDPAAIDGMCDGSSPDGTSCGLDAKGVHAVCVAETDGGQNVVMCRKTCRISTASDCSGGKSCQPYYESVGVCQ